jgi:hypothetical protein
VEIIIFHLTLILTLTAAALLVAVIVSGNGGGGGGSRSSGGGGCGGGRTVEGDIQITRSSPKSADLTFLISPSCIGRSMKSGVLATAPWSSPLLLYLYFEVYFSTLVAQKY